MSKFKAALEILYNKGKEIATNIYLSDNPTKYLFQDQAHISYINQKLPPNIWIEKNRTIGETNYYGYWVVEKVKYSKETDSKTYQSFADLKVDRFECETGSQLEEYLKKHFAKELGFDKMDTSGLTPERIKQIMNPSPALDEKTKGKFLAPEVLDAALKKEPTRTKTMERAL